MPSEPSVNMLKFESEHHMSTLTELLVDVSPAVPSFRNRGCGKKARSFTRLPRFLMQEYKGTSDTTVGLAWRHCHIFIVDSDDREGLHWFICAMDCRVPVWAFKVHIWEPLSGTSLVWPMLKRVSSKGVAAHVGALGFQQCG